MKVEIEFGEDAFLAIDEPMASRAAYGTDAPESACSVSSHLLHSSDFETWSPNRRRVLTLNLLTHLPSASSGLSCFASRLGLEFYDMQGGAFCICSI